MMVADEVLALMLIHDRLNAWERPFIRDMANLLEQRRSFTTKQLATIRLIFDRHHAWTVPTQAAPDQLTLLAEPVTHVVETLRPARLNKTGPEAGEEKAKARSAWQVQER